ncbi:unnamed protein product, partial [Amoebophrya sp. A25]
DELREWEKQKKHDNRKQNKSNKRSQACQQQNSKGQNKCGSTYGKKGGGKNHSQANKQGRSNADATPGKYHNSTNNYEDSTAQEEHHDFQTKEHSKAPASVSSSHDEHKKRNEGGSKKPDFSNTAKQKPNGDNRYMYMTIHDMAAYAKRQLGQNKSQIKAAKKKLRKEQQDPVHPMTVRE